MDTKEGCEAGGGSREVPLPAVQEHPVPPLTPLYMLERLCREVDDVTLCCYADDDDEESFECDVSAMSDVLGVSDSLSVAIARCYWKAFGS